MDELEFIRQVVTILETLTEKDPIYYHPVTRTFRCVYCMQSRYEGEPVHDESCPIIVARLKLENLRLYMALG